VVAGYFQFNKKDTSGHVPDPLSPKLKKLLELSCGKVGTRVNGNIVGCCAEQRASNRLINSYRTVPIKRIKFSEAIRPRTMQKIAMCQNCKSTFR
ncbi:MAG: hypothetical protein O9353_10625, partial [Bacteroidia bacterium]|nr:hypothetical protein [Bacteroidia bacterium]